MFIFFTYVYTYMERIEHKCNFLNQNVDGDVVRCVAEKLIDCPRSRSRGIITTACWRIRQKNVRRDKPAGVGKDAIRENSRM